MKRILILSIALFAIAGLTYGQVGASMVYDARNDINQTNQYLLGLKDFAEVTKQSQILKDTYDFYKKAQEALQKVNRAINDFYTVENIVRLQIEAVKNYGTYVSQARGFKYVSQGSITSFTNQMTTLSSTINQLLKQAQLILRDDYFKMSDAERLKILSDIESRMGEKRILMKVQFNDLKGQEEEQKILNYYKQIR